MLNTSLEWWKENANQMIGKIQLLEEKFDNETATEEDEIMYDKLIKDCGTLIARGEIENEELSKIEEKLKLHFNEGDDPRQTQITQ